VIFHGSLVTTLARGINKLTHILQMKDWKKLEKDTVKVHGVFPSSFSYSASSRKVQFHWVFRRDSGEVVTPFVHVGTYPTRNFATLGPSGLQPPLTGVYKRGLSFAVEKAHLFPLPAPGRSQSQYIIWNLADSCVFSKQSLPPIQCRHPQITEVIAVFPSLPRETFKPLKEEGNGILSPEVTELFCRVPLRKLARAAVFN